MSVYSEGLPASTSYPLTTRPTFNVQIPRPSSEVDEKFPEVTEPTPTVPMQKAWFGSSTYRTISGIFGFKERYSLVLMVIFGGALFAFALARTLMMNPANVRDKTTPGEWFWYRQPLFKPNIFIHIYTSIFTGLFAGFQFMPAVRRRAIMFHRMNGYFVLLMVVPSTICGCIVARRAFGGEINVQSAFYTAGSLTVYSAYMGYTNKHQTRKHRKWMLSKF
jgi:hypothetical protein